MIYRGVPSVAAPLEILVSLERAGWAKEDNPI